MHTHAQRHQKDSVTVLTGTRFYKMQISMLKVKVNACLSC